MTVAELIDALKDLPQEALVILARDSEGNGFQLIDDIGTGRWESEDESFLLGELTDEARAAGYTEEDVGKGPVAICLWPAD